MDMLKQIDALENGKGIQYLLDSSYNVIHHPIVMFDTFYTLIAYTNVLIDDPILNELVTTGTISMKTQEFIAREQFTELAANANRSVAMISEYLERPRLTGYIYNSENIKVAVLTMVLDTLPIDTKTVEAFDRLLCKFDSEIRDIEYYRNYGKAYHERLINMLLDGTIKDVSIYTPHVQILYDGFKDYLFVAVIDISKSRIYNKNPEYFKSMLHSMRREYKYAIFNGYIVMIMSSDSQGLNDSMLLRIPLDFINQNNLLVGISESFENLFELRAHYDRAVETLRAGINSKSDERIFICDAVTSV